MYLTVIGRYFNFADGDSNFFNTVREASEDQLKDVMKYMVTSSLFTTILYKKLPDYHFVTLEVCLSFQGT